MQPKAAAAPAAVLAAAAAVVLLALAHVAVAKDCCVRSVKPAANVSCSLECSMTTIQASVDAATANDTVWVPAGVHNGSVTVFKAVTLVGVRFALFGQD